MKVICFKGNRKVGKSRIINIILKRFFNVNLINPKIRNDVCITFLYNRKKVGICSSGDDKNSVERLKKLAGCDKIICASHNSGVVFDFLNDTYRDNVEFISCKWRYGESESGKDKENEERYEEFKAKYGNLFSV
jgi:hypothetical protein